MKIGFVGTNAGMSEEQCQTFILMLRKLAHDKSENDNLLQVHHGDHIGADVQAHMLSKSLGYELHVHPPAADRFGLRAVVPDGVLYKVSATNYEDIVTTADVLMLAPENEDIHGVLKDALDHAITKGRESEMKVVILQPNGTAEFTRYQGELNPEKIDFT